MATAQLMSVDESHCVLCWEAMEFSACGSCDHPICLKCCVKLRMLRKENDCPVCRAQLEKVVVSKGYKSWADKSTKLCRKQHSKTYGIFHETPESQAKVDEFLEHRCSECNELFRLFQQVKDHIRKVHSMMYCDICLRHLKIFTHERKCYTREAMVRHRKEGDPDDRSHRGHPLCRFCDDRYLDNDELLHHLRTNHFWCHICEKDGNQDYYSNYRDLRRHFKQAHFLCEEGECLHEKFTSVFRLKVDFQAHITQQHSSRLSKAEARQMRQLDVNIRFAPREDSDSNISARDYSFSEQGYERFRERSRMTSSGAGRDFQYGGEFRDPGRYKTKDRDRRKENQPSQEPRTGISSEQYRQTDMKGIETEDHKGMKRSKMRSLKDVLEDDHRYPSGDTHRLTGDNKHLPGGKKEVGITKAYDVHKTSNTEQKSGKIGKGEPDDVKSKKDDSRKKELVAESSVNGKEKNPSSKKKELVGESLVNGKEKKPSSKNKQLVGEIPVDGKEKKPSSKKKELVEESLFNSKEKKPSSKKKELMAESPADGKEKNPSSKNEELVGESLVNGKEKKPSSKNKQLVGEIPVDGKETKPSSKKKELVEESLFNSKQKKPSSKKKELMAESPVDGKEKNPSSKNEELVGESPVSGKEKKPSLDEGGFAGKEKNNGNLFKSKVQESNDGSSGQKAGSKSKTNNNSIREKNADPSLAQSAQEKNTVSSSSNVFHPASSLEDDFPALSTDTKQGAALNIAKPKPSYDSEFPSLSNESSNVNPSIRPRAALSAPPGFGGKLVKPNPVVGEADFESGPKFEQFSELHKPNTKGKQALSDPEKALANKNASKSSVPIRPAAKPTYDSEFPTLSTLTNGHKTSFPIKAPPGLAPPGFQPGIPVRPPPGMGWSVPINLGGSFAKETRSQKLINDIRRILNLRGESFEKFREVSGFYRKGKSSPEEYYKQCCSLLGDDHVHKVFRELIDVLPDEDKQKQLLLVYNDAKVKSKLGEESGFKFNTEKAMTGKNGMSASQPSLEDDFPALPKAAGKKKGNKSAEKISSAWTRGK